MQDAGRADQPLGDTTTKEPAQNLQPPAVTPAENRMTASTSEAQLLCNEESLPSALDVNMHRTSGFQCFVKWNWTMKKLIPRDSRARGPSGWSEISWRSQSVLQDACNGKRAAKTRGPV